ncbi:TonB-linked SusC/RagA family outer membrane protein [Tenacibaculum adriaticum]|uniref:TonB-linked SusC/RagA family outer membrane protein n=1 Tax=Tenacibaculum adriaticum TaxID=413713 RepID=A0A5S5DRL3_9FLAO|nr:SusC/RagA family TonB-linked outer membrane protein [Tenacibaculum adriaticum]TYP98028.1 TonB-linked SusC/RagA family outer membrane protein [Tenacibaculum adriaticum]
MKTKFNGILTLLLALVVQISFAQDKTISGTVSDETGPLPGVSILKKGTASGTETDFDGNYSINAKTGDVLVFSFVGMKSVEKTVGTSNRINVEMTGDNVLDEVIVTALGIKKSEKSIGYAAQVVKAKDLTEVKTTNIVNALSGKVAGINVTSTGGSVNSSSRITIRGVSTLSGNDQPLIVVDGVPIDNNSYGRSSNGTSSGVDTQNGMADVNQEDIESMNVLKGGAATALYGMRGANGVIVITTKKGTTSEKLGISINSTVSFNNAYIFPDYQNSYGQGNNPYLFKYVDGYGNSNALTTGLGGLDESWGPPLDVGLEFVQWDSFDGQPKPWVSAPDAVKDFYNTGITTVNNISLSGGTDKATYRLSIGQMDDKGILHNTDLNKKNFGGNVNFQLSEKWDAGFSANYVVTESDNSPSTGYDTADNNNVISQLVWGGRQVNWADLKDYQNLPLVETGNNAGTPVNWNQAYNNNPYWMLDNNTNTQDKTRFFGNFNIGYQISDEFKLALRTGIDTFRDKQTRRAAKGTSGNPDGYYREIIRNRTEINTELLLSYNTDINEDLNLSLNFGGNSMSNDYEYSYRGISGLQLSDLYTLANAKDGVTPVVSEYISKREINSLFGFGSLSYKDYLFLEFSGRNDWASVLPVDNNNFFYPAVSLSAIISDMVDMGETFSYLKLRGGWSKVGDAGPLSPYSITPSYEYSPESWGTTPILQIQSTLWNPNIKNQDTKEVEFGLDTRLFRNRVNLGFTYYDKKTEDVILQKNLPNSSGYSSVWDNAATITNKGIELTLGAKIFDNVDDGFKLSTTINFGQNDNEVNNIDDDPTTNNGVLNYATYWNVSTQAREGQPVGVLYGTTFARDDEGNIIFKDGKPTQGGNAVLGNSTADWTAGISFNASYKGFSLSTLFDGKKGGEIYSQTNTWGRLTGVLKETLEGRETGIVGDGVMLDPTTNTYVPNNILVTAKDFNSSTYSQAIGEAGIYDASFIKWRELSLSYAFKSSLIENTGVDAISIGASIRNVAILYKKVPHIDPETSFGNSIGTQGLEYSQIPPTRSISLNLNVKF